LGGNMILMAAFLRKPSGRPVEATAFPVLTLKASFRPAVILSSLRLAASGRGEPSAVSARFFRSSSGDWAWHAATRIPAKSQIFKVRSFMTASGEGIQDTGGFRGGQLTLGHVLN